MDHIQGTLDKRLKNVNVNKDINNNVYDDNVATRIREAIDKPRVIAKELAEKLNAPGNLKFYIKLAYQYSTATLFECLALTEEARKEGNIRTTPAQYFYGILKMRAGKNEQSISLVEKRAGSRYENRS